MFFEVLGIEIMTQTHLEKFQPLSIDKMNAFLWPEIALFCQQAKKIWYKLNSPHPHHDVWKSLKLYHLKMGKTKLVHSNVDFWRENSKFYVQLVLLTKFFFSDFQTLWRLQTILEFGDTFELLVRSHENQFDFFPKGPTK